MSFRLRSIAAAALIAILPARAATVVTACGTDTAAGGTNLATALAAGGDISIRCAGGVREIRLTTAWVFRKATAIDGGNQVTLVGPGSGPMFVSDGPRQLSLRNLAIRNPPSNPADPNLFTGIVYDDADQVSIELDNVQVSDTRLPFAVRRFVARNSTFTGNGDANNSDFGIVMAGDLDLEGVTFRNNLSRPFAALWRGDPIAKGEKITARVVNGVFEGNRRPALWMIGSLAIDGSHFTNNGDAAPFKPGGNGHLYGGRIYLELGTSIAGAVEVVYGRAVITQSTFQNNRGMLGGAVLAWGSSLTVQTSQIENNQAVSAGAIAYLSPEGSGLPGAGGFRLALGHDKIRGNTAVKDGGALFVLGNVSGDALLISGNKAGESGGAIAVVGPGISPAEAVPAAIAAKLPSTSSRPGTLALSRVFVLDNTAAGDAVDARAAELRFGNLLASRNTSTSGATIHGADMELANSTVIGNTGQGVRIDAGPAKVPLRLANTIVAANSGGNCTGALAGLATGGANLQYPGSDCGASIASGDPSLDVHFEPTLGSPARTSGTMATCTGYDLVDGRDVYGKARGPSTCSIGAVEANFERDVVQHLPLSSDAHFPWLLLIILIFLILCFIAGLYVGWRYHRWRREKARREHFETG